MLVDKVSGNSLEERSVKAIKYCHNHGFLKAEDHAIVVSRSSLGKHFGSTCAIYDVGLIVNEVADTK